jgi:hypothetical protein
MIYLKAAAVGIVSALVLAILWTLAATLTPLSAMLLSSLRSGSGGLGAVSVGLGSTLVAAVVGFVLGFGWWIRRSRR